MVRQVKEWFPHVWPTSEEFLDKPGKHVQFLDVVGRSSLSHWPLRGLGWNNGKPYLQDMPDRWTVRGKNNRLNPSLARAQLEGLQSILRSRSSNFTDEGRSND